MSYLDHEWILEQSRITGFSIPTIQTLIEIIYLQSENSTNLKEQTIQLIQALRKPQKWFSIRINPVRDDKYGVYTRKDIIKDLHSNPTEVLHNMLFLSVEGPFFLEKHSREIIVDKFAAESIMTGANLYIPGFVKPLPKFQKGENFSIYGPNHVHVANGVTKYSYKEILGMKNGTGIETIKSLYKIPSYRESEFYSKGYLSDHSFGPFLGCNLLMELYQPEKDQIIFDVCSAPGHKSCALSEIGYSKYGIFPKIISIDRSSKRLEALHKDILRLGLENIQVIAKRFEKLADSHPELLNSADFLILDPPCSALGTRPKLSITHTTEDFRSFFLLQRRLLKEIPQYLKEGGILLYTTCTLTPLENEGIVSILKNKYEFELLDAIKLIPQILDKSSLEHMNQEFLQGISRDLDKIRTIPMTNTQHVQDLDRYMTLSQEDSKKIMRVNPIGAHSTGYFIALLQKKAM